MCQWKYTLSFLLCGLLPLPGVALAAPSIENPRAPNLEAQFRNLAIHGDAIGAGRGVARDACNCVHYQGMARGWDAEGRPSLFLSRSGNDGPIFGPPGVPDWAQSWVGTRCFLGGCPSFTNDRKPGELAVAMFDTRSRDGERMRSNLLKKGVPVGKTPPPMNPLTQRSVDEVKRSYLFNGHFGDDPDTPGLDGPKYMHPGGMQIVGDVLVIALEWYCEGAFGGSQGDGQCSSISDISSEHHQIVEKRGAIALIDISNPTDAKLIGYQVLRPDEPMRGIYLVAATLVHDDEHPGITEDRYLFIWTDNDSSYYFGWSSTSDLKTKDPASDLIAIAPYEWNKEYLYHPSEDKWMKFQSLNFVRDQDGGLYLIGTASTSAIANEGDDWARLYKVDLGKLNTSDIQNAITYVAERHFKLQQDDLNLGDFGAAGGAYVSSSGQLMLYSAGYDNSGTSNPGDTGGALRMGEFRNIDVRHDGALPDPLCGGWVELYENSWGWFQTRRGLSLMFDYLDEGRDDWNNLEHYDDYGDKDFGDKASAMRWNLVPGQFALLYRDDGFSGTNDDWPIVLEGRGQITNLYGVIEELPDTWNDKISSVDITSPPGKLQYEVCDGLDNNCNGFSDEGLQDTDDDGWGRVCDNCPDIANQDQEDSDRDGVGNLCDNCPSRYNPDQLDGDGNGIGDACENQPPVAKAGDDIEADELTEVLLNGSGSYDVDDAWDTLTCTWQQLDGTPVAIMDSGSCVARYIAPEVGVAGEQLEFELTVSDGSLSDSDRVVHFIRNANTPPNCADARPTRDTLWPPYRWLRWVRVINVTDPDNDAVEIEITGVTQDEPVSLTRRGRFCPDARLHPRGMKDVVRLRAERRPWWRGGNGRVYAIHFTATDGLASCQGQVRVQVPLRYKGAAIDDGQNFDSTDASYCDRRGRPR